MRTGSTLASHLLQGWTEAPDLAKWVRRQRVARAQSALTEERLQVLYAMGFEFGDVAQLTEEWESKFDQLIEWLLWQVCMHYIFLYLMLQDWLM